MITVYTKDFCPFCVQAKRQLDTMGFEYEEINVEARELFIQNGGESFEYIPCLNDNEHSIKFLEYIIKQNLLGWNYKTIN